MSSCNETLIESKDAVKNEVDIHGIQFHHLGLIISALFGLIAVLVADWLIFQHARHYLKPWEQKHIIRILFMIPIYAIVSFISYMWYTHYIYFEVIRDCYEAFAIASFFTLLCNYIAPTLHEQKEYFRRQEPKNWLWPMPWMQKCTGGRDKGFLRRPRSGLTWFNIIWIGVFQYCLVRVLMTLVSVFTQAIGRYCESSLSPAFGHVWVSVIEALSVTVAMYCLIQFYAQLKDDLAEHKPFLKLLCIKLVIFLSFWQNMLISFLSSSTHGVIKPSPQIAYPDIKVGIPCMLLCVEMAIFAVLHVFAFSWKPYLISNAMTDPLYAPGGGYGSSKPKYLGGPLGIKALMDAYNPWDFVKASARGFRWLFVGRKHRHHDASYQTDGTKLGDIPRPQAYEQYGNQPGMAHAHHPSDPGRPSGPYEFDSDGAWDADIGYRPQYHGQDPYMAANSHLAPAGATAYRPQYHHQQSYNSNDTRDEYEFVESHGPSTSYPPPAYSQNSPPEDRAGLLSNAAHPGHGRSLRADESSRSREPSPADSYGGRPSNQPQGGWV